MSGLFRLNEQSHTLRAHTHTHTCARAHTRTHTHNQNAHTWQNPDIKMFNFYFHTRNEFRWTRPGLRERTRERERERETEWDGELTSMIRFVKVINDAAWDQYGVLLSGTRPQHNSCPRGSKRPCELRRRSQNKVTEDKSCIPWFLRSPEPENCESECLIPPYSHLLAINDG